MAWSIFGKKAVSMDKTVRKAMTLEDGLVKQKEKLIAEFESRHPNLIEFLRGMMTLEAKAKKALDSGNLHEADRLNNLVDSYEQKILATLNDTEKYAWSHLRARLKDAENQLDMLAYQLHR
jgi:phosphopantetheine adenylyltransferase